MIIIFFEGVIVSKKGRRKTNQPQQNVKSALHRYKFWILGAALGVTLITIGIIASQVGGNHHIASTTTTINPSDIPRISAGAVKAKLDAVSNLIIVDTRSEAEYEQSHIAGAISIPLERIAQRYSELNVYNEVVIYCD
jgi:hypothetical protein